MTTPHIRHTGMRPCGSVARDGRGAAPGSVFRMDSAKLILLLDTAVSRNRGHSYKPSSITWGFQFEA